MLASPRLYLGIFFQIYESNVTSSDKDVEMCQLTGTFKRGHLTTEIVEAPSIHFLENASTLFLEILLRCFANSTLFIDTN
jgi:hypothetical protein